jgi:putative MFS transporter
MWEGAIRQAGVDSYAGSSLEAVTAPSIDWRIGLTVLVASLGYFVDVYDLFLLSVYRVPSLTEIGVPAVSRLSVGVMLMNMQMAGVVVGGIIWGILGDKRGRTSVLFGSIFLYSIANIANAFVHDINSYCALRFLAGLGLAGEVGAAVTLISEVLDKNKRTFGSALIFSAGMLGAMAAALVERYLPWRTGFLLGGVLGMVLLLMRVGLLESAMYSTMTRRECPRGNIGLLLKKARWKNYLWGILCGIPTWFGAMLTAFLPEFSTALGVTGHLTAADGVLFGHVGVFMGTVASCFLSQFLRSRRKVMLVFLLISTTAHVIIFLGHGFSSTSILALVTLGGFGAGYGAIYAITAAELYGTNLRATVATTIPNFVRASTIPMMLAIKALIPSFGLINGGLTIRLVVTLIGIVGILFLHETFNKELDYVET